MATNKKIYLIIIDLKIFDWCFLQTYFFLKFKNLIMKISNKINKIIKLNKK